MLQVEDRSSMASRRPSPDSTNALLPQAAPPEAQVSASLTCPSIVVTRCDEKFDTEQESTQPEDDVSVVATDAAKVEKVEEVPVLQHIREAQEILEENTPNVKVDTQALERLLDRVISLISPSYKSTTTF